LASEPNIRTIREGDVETDPNKQEAAPPPSLRKPGETLPTNNDSTGEMRPVQFPKPHTEDTPGTNPDEQSSAAPASTPPTAAGASPSQTTPSGNTPSSGQSSPSTSASPSQSAPNAPTDGKQQPPAPSNQLVSESASGGAASAVAN
jgi:hypothetical protein